jgi:hypothetical protein
MDRSSSCNILAHFNGKNFFLNLKLLCGVAQALLYKIDKNKKFIGSKFGKYGGKSCTLKNHKK